MNGIRTHGISDRAQPWTTLALNRQVTRCVPHVAVGIQKFTKILITLLHQSVFPIRTPNLLHGINNIKIRHSILDRTLKLFSISLSNLLEALLNTSYDN